MRTTKESQITNNNNECVFLSHKKVTTRGRLQDSPMGIENSGGQLAEMNFRKRFNQIRCLSRTGGRKKCEA